MKWPFYGPSENRYNDALVIIDLRFKVFQKVKFLFDCS